MSEEIRLMQDRTKEEQTSGNYKKLPFFAFRFYKADIYHKGVYLASKRFSLSQKQFYFRNKAFNILPNHPSYSVAFYLSHTTFRYSYDFDNPDPLILHSVVKASMDSDRFAVILKSDGFRKLHAMSKQAFWANIFNWKTLAVIGAILIAIYYFSSGGTVT